MKCCIRMFSSGKKLMISQCPYRILNISPTATPQQIKDAYYELAKIYHPDTSGSAHNQEVLAKFQEAYKAYKILIDPEQRAKYDKSIGIYKKSVETPESFKAKEEIVVSEKEQYKRLRKKALQYKDIDDFMKNIEEHKALHSKRWDDIVKKYGTDYDHFESVERETKDKYIKYNAYGDSRYWDTVENHEYYSKSWFSILKDNIIDAVKRLKNYL